MNREALLALDDETLGALVWFGAIRMHTIAMEEDTPFKSGMEMGMELAQTNVAKSKGWSKEIIAQSMELVGRQKWPPPRESRDLCIQAGREARDQILNADLPEGSA